MAFIDKCKIVLIAGNGGDGIVSWRRETHVPEGGPAGGNGGNGGSIWFVGNHNETSLEFLKYKKIIRAKHGEKGDIKNQHGANAEDVFINVPLGTVVYDAITNEILADINIDQQKYLVAQGGLGGHGNTHFKSAFNKAPNLYELGELGENIEVVLELKTIADIGIIGLPNAGKSTLISSFTNAKPKTANYMFTTLNPVLGTIYRDQNRIIFADIPGLIEGAHTGVGLGHDFLKHIERCFLLIHLISLDPNDNSDIISAYETIVNELKQYKQSLFNKPIVLVANKIDQIGALENLQILKEHLKDNQYIKVISALTNLHVDAMLDDVIKIYFDQKKIYEQRLKEHLPVDQILKWASDTPKNKELDKTIKIVKVDDHVFEVFGEYLKYWVHRIPLKTQDNLIRFNQKLQSINFNQQLLQAGAIAGDSIKIYDITLEFEE
ncbi:GTPase ObgE [Ureaplasma urealyticum]|uniref:GTPase ObgE n=1 Tax=Ureaplasma urealyticum TaxID=2130 RepID=UPI00290F2F58|nr:GTPase ObgE [Ureaplasma urealyticum]MDU3865059.1 GTPase ObgE [Ureaplasma urealyticum]